MKLIKATALALATIIGVSTASAEDVRVKGGTYVGTVSINMGFGDPMPVENQTVVITATGTGTCDFRLDNFSLSGNPEESIGNIYVQNVTTTQNAGSDLINFNGKAENISLAENEIIADAIVEGTENTARELDMQIHVIWHMDPTDSSSDVPIEVTFKGKWNGTSGIEDVYVNPDEVSVRYFDLKGSEVKAPTTPGLYIVRQGDTVTKIAK